MKTFHFISTLILSIISFLYMREKIISCGLFMVRKITKDELNDLRFAHPLLCVGVKDKQLIANYRRLI